MKPDIDQLWARFRELREKEIELRKAGREASTRANDIHHELREAIFASNRARVELERALESER